METQADVIIVIDLGLMKITQNISLVVLKPYNIIPNSNSRSSLPLKFHDSIEMTIHISLYFIIIKIDLNKIIKIDSNKIIKFE